ncbi:serine/threonine-protein kinase [Prauserella oleivorans]
MTGDVSGDLTGRRLGNYRIDGVLGRGGMSVMYKATDVRLGRKVALKVIGEHLGADAEFRERFVDEARNTSAIDHANIVPLYDFGELDGMLYIAMRLVDGSDLASLIEGSPMVPERAIGLLEQVADALDTLHNRGLVHLDVKPANVLVTSRESAREHVYVADFGLTRRGATGHRTRGGDFLGSPTYAAPEHLRGEPLDGRTDQYALACMLYACLAGSPPFTGDVQAVISGHLNSEPPTVSQAVPSLPAAIDDVVRKGMAKKPAERYGSCVELINAAREALRSPPAMPVRQAVAVGQHGEGVPCTRTVSSRDSTTAVRAGSRHHSSRDHSLARSSRHHNSLDRSWGSASHPWATARHPARRRSSAPRRRAWGSHRRARRPATVRRPVAFPARRAPATAQDRRQGVDLGGRGGRGRGRRRRRGHPAPHLWRRRGQRGDRRPGSHLLGARDPGRTRLAER